MARMMVTRLGMSDELGNRVYGQKEELIFLGREISEQRDYSEAVAEQIDREVRRIVDEAYQRARSILLQYRKQLDDVANLLLEKETITREEFGTGLSASAAQAQRYTPTGVGLAQLTQTAPWHARGLSFASRRLTCLPFVPCAAAPVRGAESSYGGLGQFGAEFDVSRHFVSRQPLFAPGLDFVFGQARLFADNPGLDGFAAIRVGDRHAAFQHFGWAMMTSSTSRGQTWKPPGLMSSFLQPTM